MTPIQIRLIEYGLIIAAVVLGYFAWHHHVYQQGYDACQTAQTKAVEEGKKKYEKTSQKVKRLPDDTLRREFCGWVRDADLPTCLRDLPAIRP